MKNNIKYIFEFYKQSLNTSIYTFEFFSLILLATYGVVQIAHGFNYNIGFILILSDVRVVMWLLIILLVNTKNIYNIFVQNNSFAIRFGTKKKYLFELLKTVCFVNLFTIILFFSFVIIGLNIFNSCKIIEEYEIYQLPSNIYMIYIAIRLLILTQLIFSIIVIFLKKINSTLVILLVIFFDIIIGTMYFETTKILSISEMPLFIGSYFQTRFYDNFTLEISCLFIQILFYLLLIFVSYKIVSKRIGDISK